MKILKVLFFVVFIYFVPAELNAQIKEFKEVKTADDVIENFIITNGGKENLESIKSILMKGKIDAMGKTIPVTVYSSSDFVYNDFGDSLLGFTRVFNKKEKNGWQKAKGKVRDFTSDEIKKYEEIFEGGLWGYYINKDEFGITCRLEQNGKAGDKPAYVVDFMKGDNTVYTTYFDSTDFNRIKQVRGDEEVMYEDFHEAGTSGLQMPYKITQRAPMTVDIYEFNTYLEENLLKKPEIKQ